jgi:hypothetical protein
MRQKAHSTAQEGLSPRTLSGISIQPFKFIKMAVGSTPNVAARTLHETQKSGLRRKTAKAASLPRKTLYAEAYFDFAACSFMLVQETL